MGNAGSGVKKFFTKAWDGVKSIGSKVLGIGSTIRDGIGKGFNFVKKIPVVGQIVEKAVDTPIPFLKGATLRQVGDVASSALDTGQSLAKGDITGGLDNMTRTYNLGQGLRKP